MKIRLGEIAYARSGDKGSGATLGIIAHTPDGYTMIKAFVTAEAVEAYFKPMGCGPVRRFEWENLLALQFALPSVLAGGGSRSLRIDSQGKTIGQAVLEMQIEVPEHLVANAKPIA
ncbi:MAG TPA: hypothetical protein PLJ47_08745 [Candidatus Hydrogenedentes bacterium]|nr:hypothetical protein [Candidatus Hydrogenedentota bacterium]